MTNYGFRLFRMELFEGMGRTAMPFGTNPDTAKETVHWRYAGHLAKTMGDHEGVRYRGAPPTGAPDDAAEMGAQSPTDPMFRLSSSCRIGCNIAFTLRDGQNRGFDAAMNMESDVADFDLKAWAPARNYRGVFVLPTVEKTGVLALECIDRRCPITPLIRWTRRWSQEDAHADGGSWWRLRATEWTDDQRLQHLIATGRIDELVLRKTEANVGRGRDREVLRLSAPVIDGSIIARVRDTLAGWLHAAATIDALSDEDGAQQIKSWLGDDIERLDFDDGYVRISGGEGAKPISPGRLSEVFTYPIGQADTPPGNAEFYTAVSETLAELRVQTALHLRLSDWP